MLLSINHLLGYKIEALDGTLGKVHDVLFDQQTWDVRYFVAETGSWLTGRRVLLSPAVVKTPQAPQRHLPVALTRRQVKDSPPADLEKPVSRQYEEQLFQYYDWVPYWLPDYSGDFFPQPFAAPVAPPPEEDEQAPPEPQTSLRSVREIAGYRIQARDGEMGHLEDLIAEDQTWKIRYLVIDTGKWLRGKQVLVAPDWIEELDWAGQKAVVCVTRETVESSPPYDPAKPINREYEERLYDYYGRPKYWA